MTRLARLAQAQRATSTRGVAVNFDAFAARFALVVSCGLMTATPASAQFWQCAPYAREVSGIQIRGNANTWWGQAAGRYERGHAPKVGAVLSFESTRRMRVGHVAMVVASRQRPRSPADPRQLVAPRRDRDATSARSTCRPRATGARSRSGTGRRAGSAPRPIRPTASSIRTHAASRSTTTDADGRSRRDRGRR